LSTLCPPAPAGHFTGTLSLQSSVSDTRLVASTVINVTVTADVDARGNIRLGQISGTGSESIVYNPTALFGCGPGRQEGGRPPEGMTGTVTSAGFTTLIDGQPNDVVLIVPRVTGNKTSNSCSLGVWTSKTVEDTGVLGGEFTGSAFVAANRTAAIDFNRDVTDQFGRRTRTTGRLERQP